MRWSYQLKTVASMLSKTKSMPRAPMMMSILTNISLPGLAGVGSCRRGISEWSESKGFDQKPGDFALCECLFAKAISFICCVYESFYAKMSLQMLLNWLQTPFFARRHLLLSQQLILNDKKIPQSLEGWGYGYSPIYESLFVFFSCFFPFDSFFLFFGFPFDDGEIEFHIVYKTSRIILDGS